jgi:4-hydroxy-2-oxoheptanedioate aldolase
MRENLALTKWRRGEPSVGGWLSLGNVHIAEVMANAGFDWLVVDMQHGLIAYSDMLRMLPAISTTETTPLVRVSSNNLPEINKALDAGAMGVIVPLVNTAEQAAAAVSACLFPPDGTRSYGPTRAVLYGGRGYAAEANTQIACIVMIETQQAIDNLEAILATPHLGGVYVGPSDLALSLGLPARGDTDDERHLAAVGHILASCKRHGVPAGIHCGSLAYAKLRLAAGFDFVTLGSELGFLSQAMTRDLAAVRAPQSAGSA